MKKILMSVAAVAILAGGVGACTAYTSGGDPSPQLTFANYQPVQLNVARTGVEYAYETPNDPQDISGQFVVSPAEAVKRYAENRFVARGTPDGDFTVSILDARVHMTVLKEDNRVLKWAGAGQEDEYRVFLKVKVTPRPDGVARAASTVIRYERTLVMPSSATLAEREMKQINFLEKLIADVDGKIMELLDSTPSIR